MAAGLLAGLITKGISAAKTFIQNAQVGKAVLASGAQVQTTTALPLSQTTQVNPPGSVGGVPLWVWFVGGFVVLFMFVAFIFKRK